MRTCVKTIACLAFLAAFAWSVPARAELFGPPGEAPQRDREVERLDQIEEARLDVELLDTEVQTQKAGLKAIITSLKSWESGIRPGGGAGGGAESPEEQKRIVETLRQRYAYLRVATLDTGKKLAHARRRLAELEGRPVNSPGQPTASGGEEPTAPGPKSRGRSIFIHAGRYHINRTRIEYVEQAPNGPVRVYFIGNEKGTLILSSETAKVLLEALAEDGR